MKISGPKLKAVLIARCMYQYQLCRTVNLSPAYLSHIIHGKIEPTEALVKRISDALKIRPGMLMAKKGKDE